MTTTSANSRGFKKPHLILTGPKNLNKNSTQPAETFMEPKPKPSHPPARRGRPPSGITKFPWKGYFRRRVIDSIKAAALANGVSTSYYVERTMESALRKEGEP
jgi:hypothetical protein